MFVGKMCYSHSTSLLEEVQMAGREFSGSNDKMLEVTCSGLASHPGEVARSTPRDFMG